MDAHVFKSIILQDLIHHKQKIDKAYQNVPLYFNATSNDRSSIMEKIGRCIDEENGYQTEDAFESNRRDGSSRGTNSREYDWKRKNSQQRVEFKYCMIGTSGARRWCIKLEHVKWDLFDILMLGFYTPYGLYFYIHDQHTGICKTKMGRGDKIKIETAGKTINETWKYIQKALSTCTFLRYVSFQDPLFMRFQMIRSTTTQYYLQTQFPLFHKSYCTIGCIAEYISRHYMEYMVHANKYITITDGEKYENNAAQTKQDWCIKYSVSSIVGPLQPCRVEHKSARVRYDIHGGHWVLELTGVKKKLFDRLMCTLILPDGFYMYQFDILTCIPENNGAKPKMGKSKKFVARKATQDFNEAVQEIKDKIKEEHGVYIGRFLFQKMCYELADGTIIKASKINKALKLKPLPAPQKLMHDFFSS